MIHEPASNADFYPRFETDDYEYDYTAELMWLRELVTEHMHIDQESTPRADQLPVEDRAILQRGNSQLRVSFAGTLTGDSETTYDALETTLRERDLYPLLRSNEDEAQPHIIHIVAGIPEKPAERRPWLNLALFLATIFSVLITGTLTAAGYLSLDNPELASDIGSDLAVLGANLWRGIPYAAAILAILVPHEMGHYLMMRRHKVVATLPYFIPAPLISPFGTFGAAIQLRESLRNRKTLLDVGASGPIAGFVIAVPILLIGLATVTTVPMDGTIGFVEGNSILYALGKFITQGQWLPNGETDILVNQLSWAGWTGLFVTALNLLPIGQLDGGHIMYSLLGDRARLIFWPALTGMIVLALFVSSTWVLFVLLLFLVGSVYAVPLDNVTPLDGRRKLVAIAAIVIFFLSFPPIPIYVPGESSGLISGLTNGFAVPDPAQSALFTVGIVSMRLAWLRRRMFRA